MTKIDLEIMGAIIESKSADDWADWIDIWSASGHFSRPEWRLLRLSDLNLLEKRLVKKGGYHEWQFRINRIAAARLKVTE